MATPAGPAPEIRTSTGAVRSGVGHGIFCLGCCWMLMGVLFVGGIMSLAWIASIALLAGLAEFESDLHRHVHKENNILFPRALARAGVDRN